MKRFFSQAMIFVRKCYADRQMWMIIIAIGVWLIVLQNFGVFSDKSGGAQSVYVVGGRIDADVSGSVEVDNTVDVQGYVSVDGSVELDGGHTSVWVDGGQINTW